jgi:hypothetical protein
MCLAILSDNAAAVKGKNDRQVRKTNIMQHLVEGALQEGGVYGYNGYEALGS